MKRKTRQRLICIFTAVFLLTVFPSCGGEKVKEYPAIERVGGESYNVFSAGEGNTPRFSFEYPAAYELIEYNSMPENLSTNVRMSRSSLEEAREGYIKLIEIHIDKHSGSAEIKLNERVDEHKSVVSAGTARDLRLAEKISIVFSGIKGWEIVISKTSLPFPPAPLVNKPTPTMSREIFFDYQGMVWRISLFSDLATYEQAEADFEHVLGTFVIEDE
ncbi:hypothetical protein ACFLW1_01400 [Chloroflexota bacterium]